MAQPDCCIRYLNAVCPVNFEHSVIFANLNPAFHTRKITELDPTRDCYWSPAVYAKDATTNTLDKVIEVVALIIDDVGSAQKSRVSELTVEMKLGGPTAVIRTSPDNYQWTYKLSRPIPVREWKAWREGVEAKISAPRRLDNHSAQCLFRMPMGINTRADGCAVELVGLDPEAVLDVDRIVLVAAAASAARHGETRAGKVHDLRRLMLLVPNGTGYGEWMEQGFRLWALALDKELAREVWLEWSSRWTGTGAKYAAEDRWDREIAGCGDRTDGWMLVAAAYAANRDGADAWWQGEAKFWFDDGSVAPEVPPGPARVKFARGEKKQILSTMDNAKRGLIGLGIVCGYDEFHHRVTIQHAGAPYEGRLTDHAVLRLRVKLTEIYGKDFGPGHIGDAVMALALKDSFNPVTDMLREAEAGWDGVRRLDRLGPDYFHTSDTRLARAAFRKVMLAAVRRARRPGCKFDQILVTESPEGWDKSSAWELLAGAGNFSDASILGKDARQVQEELADIWIHESADLSGLTRAEVEHVKAFASRTNDRARPAYGRYLIDQPRQSIEVGTTNADAYLLSTTGNRRFWPFKLLSSIDMDALRRDRMQLWGEAAAAESAGETLVLDKALWGEAAVEQEKRRVIDPWEDELANLKGHMAVSKRNGKDFITRVGVHEFLRQRNQGLTVTAGKRIAEIMRKLGWHDCRYKIDGTATRGYEKEESDTSDVDDVTNVSPKNTF